MLQATTVHTYACIIDAVSECALCHTQVVTKGHHVWGHHMSQRPFSCSECNQGFGLHDRGVLLRHIQRVHKNQANVVDSRDSLNSKVQQFLEICFPPGSLVSGQSLFIFLSKMSKISLKTIFG